MKQDVFTKGLQLTVLARDRKTQPLGIRAHKPHLEHDVWALPGETLQQLSHRVLAMAKGQGTAVLLAFYADEVLH